MVFSLHLTDEARANLAELERDSGLGKRLKAVRKTLARLESNPRHPGLRSHKFESLAGPRGEEVFVVYAEQNTPAAYRVFWCYGPDKGQITVLGITSHP
ncbi:MAG TPA: hypothetical protein VFA98_12045 [Thermoanaerobaculia bacterium]|nr:hypothetical protein [Thermoanaerobaculia bacterium]